MTSKLAIAAIIVVALGVIGAAAGGGLYYFYPVQVSTFAGLTRNYLISWTPSRHDNYGIECGLQSRRGCRGLACRLRHRRAPPPETGRATTKQSLRIVTRSSSEINTKNVGKLKVLCTYDVGEYAAFESGLIMVDNALIGTTQFDIFSLNPATCAAELANARGLSSHSSAGQSRRRLHGRHAVSRHPGRAGAGL